MTQPRMRPATTGDVRAIAHVHRWSRAAYYGTTADPDDGREEMWAHLLGQPERIAHVVEDDNQIIGFLLTRRVAEPEVALEMMALYVLPDRHGQGYGAQLYELFESELGPGELGVLEVWAGNDRAIAFYRARGWRPTERTRPGPQGCGYVTYRLPAVTEEPGPRAGAG